MAYCVAPYRGVGTDDNAPPPLWTPSVYYKPGVPPLAPWSDAMLRGYMYDSGVQSLVINSTVRTVEQQVAAMLENERRGNRISYASSGKRVIDHINERRRAGALDRDIVASGAALMREVFQKQGAVSYHVDEFRPDGFEAIDIAPDSLVPSSSKPAFIERLREAKQKKPAAEVKELILPDDDPAIHVVLIRDASAQVAAALDDIASGGKAATYEGEDAGALEAAARRPVGLALATGFVAVFCAGGLLWWRSRARRK